MIEILIILATFYYCLGCISLAYSDLCKLESVRFFKWIENAPHWIVTPLVVMSWPYVAYHLKKARCA